MKNRPEIWVIAALCLVFTSAAGYEVGKGLWAPHQPRYQTSRFSVIAPMLRLADLRPGDVVADLGCGDGRIVIEAVKAYDVKGVCVEIDEQLLIDARSNARLAGVSDRVRFIRGDLFDTDFQSLDVVTLFLSPDFNARLEPILQKHLKPGSRVVSLTHDMPSWRPDAVEVVQSDGRDWVLRKWVQP